MRPVKWGLGNVLVLMFCLGTASPGKVLIWPADNSHWINLRVIVQELTARGHHITVLWPSFFQVKDSNQLPNFHREEVRVPFPKAEMDDLLRSYFHLTMYEQPEMSLWEFSSKFYHLLADLFSRIKILCDTVVRNEEQMKKLQLAGFDLLVADPLFPCGELVAEKLQIPFVYSLRFSEGNTLERLCGGLPAPPSYVPASTSGLTDRMSFPERMTNLLIYSACDFLFHLTIFRDWSQYYSDVLGRPTTLCETMGKAEVWLIRTYWDFEFPQPLLPSFEFVGGLHCQPAKPLPEAKALVNKMTFKIARLDKVRSKCVFASGQQIDKGKDLETTQCEYEEPTLLHSRVFLTGWTCLSC